MARRRQGSGWETSVPTEPLLVTAVTTRLPFPVRRLRITREGWWWLLVAGLLWGTGLYKGVNLLTLLGILMTVAWAMNLVLARRRLRHIYARRWVRGPVFAGAPTVIKAEVRNDGGRDALGIRLVDGGPSPSPGWFLVRLAPGERRRFRREAIFPYRGRHASDCAEVSTGYPLGLVECSAARGNDEEILVLPRPIQLRNRGLRRLLGEACLSSARQRRRPQQHPAAQTEFHSLRTFRPGDSPRLIHWKTSARRNELMVREFEDSPSENLVLVVDPWPTGLPTSPDPAAPEAIAAGRDPAGERVIRVAASLCREWCRRPGDRLVLAAGAKDTILRSGVTGPAYEARLLETLALLEAPVTGQHSSLVDAVRSEPLPSGPLLLLVAGSTSLGDRLSAYLHRPVVTVDVCGPSGSDLIEEGGADAP